MTNHHRMFELFLQGARPILARHYGYVFADEVLVEARMEYERVQRKKTWHL